MKFLSIWVVAVLLTVVLKAQASETGLYAGSDAAAAASLPAAMPENARSSREIRERSNFSFNVAWAPMHLPFPMALGFNANYVASSSWMLGIDYMNSDQAIQFLSYDLGELKEQSLTLQARRFHGNSFNWKMGIGHRKTEARLSANLFDLANNPAQTASELRSNFLRLGFGNQWQINKKYTLAVDWLTMNIPIGGEVKTSASQYANSPSSKQDIENAENILKYYPSGSILQFEAGLIF